MRLRSRRLPFRRPAGFWHRMERLFRFRLIIPMLRSRHTPEFTARGVMVGLVWAFTPTVGMQMPLVFATWLVCKRFLRWDFSLIQGLAWTWVTNAFTVLPCYYLFLVTGQMLRGRWSDLSGYDSFALLFHAVFRDDLTFEETLRTMARVLLVDWGAALAIGALPWAAFMGWLGYRLSLRFVIAYRHARERRAAKRAARLAERAKAAQLG